MAHFKLKTHWTRLEEAHFQTQTNPADLGVDLTIGTQIKIPKLADIPGREGHNLIEATRTESIALLHNAWENKMAFCVWGDTGVSKSATIEDFFKEVHKKDYAGRETIFINGLSRPADIDDLKPEGEGIMLSPETDVYKNPGKYFFMADVRVAYLEGYDIKGVPNVAKKSNILSTLIPPLIHLASHKDAAGIIFFDEVNRAVDPGIRSALLAVFDKNNKRLGERILSRNVMPVAAGNVGFGFTDVAEIDAALKNRGGACYLNLTIQEWIKYAKSSNVIHPLVISFIESLPNKTEFLFAGRPSPGAGEDVFKNLLKYPTYRGYELLSDGLHKALLRFQKGELKSHDEVIDEAVHMAGAVTGHEFAKAFAAYIQKSKGFKSLAEIEKMEDTSANANTKLAIMNVQLPAYAEKVFIDREKGAERELKAWIFAFFKLPPEKMKAFTDGFKAQVAGINDKDVKALPVNLFTQMRKELNAALKSGVIDQDTYDRIDKALSAAGGNPDKAVI